MKEEEEGSFHPLDIMAPREMGQHFYQAEADGFQGDMHALHTLWETHSEFRGNWRHLEIFVNDEKRKAPDADLRKFDLRGGDFHDFDLEGVDLSRAAFDGSILSGANLSNSKLTDVCTRRTSQERVLAST